MKRRFRPCRRTRLRLTLLMVLSLLVQQVALAAYMCPLADMPVANTAMTTHCQGMSTLQQEQAPALCAPHCAQQASATQDARLQDVPPLLMPALLPSPPTVAALPVSGMRLPNGTAVPPGGIAPTLRFRVLLI